MSDFFMGQVMMTGFGYAPRNFAQCNGALLSISQNSALFTLLGVTYGGDGVTTFALPDLRGRTPAGGGFNSVDPAWQPPSYAWGQIGGVETVSLTGDQNGPHTHGMTATTAVGTSAFLDGQQVLAQASGSGQLYGAPQALIPLSANPTSVAGNGSPHDNMQPYQVINFNIALYGIYPSRG
ncbi:phage tail protein [Brevundimonas sp.]|uniref:phage tail protein n=1 Tax=Brevundimonas sp. TaxID=1871086 RepID=UPI003D0CF1B1